MKILVIEDFQLIRDMLVMACGTIAPGAVAKGATTGIEGVGLCHEFQPDIIFLDLALPDGDGVDFMPQLFAACRAAKVIALTSHVDEFTLHRALKAHVHGFVDKNEQPLPVLQEAIRTVMSGRHYFSSTAHRLRLAMRGNPLADFSKLLSDKEQELLKLFGEGLDNDQIAEKTNLAWGTVRNHRNNVMAKLNLHSTPELMRYAIDKGFVRPRKTATPTQ